jgi:hypothetical protein
VQCVRAEGRIEISAFSNVVINAATHAISRPQSLFAHFCQAFTFLSLRNPSTLRAALKAIAGQLGGNCELL